MMIRSFNIPEKLKPLIDKWNYEGKEYFLTPDNMHSYHGHKIVYAGGEDIPLSGWYAKNGDTANDYKLTRNDVEEIQQELLQYFKTTRWTLILDWHCNYQCAMCPYHGSGVLGKEDYFVDRGGQKRVVSKEEAYARIDRLAEYGIKTLSIMSAGEILLYPYWVEVSRYAHKKGMDLWTVTNGSLWTEDTVRQAVNLGYTDIRVSLDALSFDIYSKIRSNKCENFERAMKLPELLMKYGIKTNVHFVKQKENMQEVQSFLEYWKRKKVDSISIAHEFVMDGEAVISRFDHKGNEYIDGLCEAFGNMQTFTDGNTTCCCGTEAYVKESHKILEKDGCKAYIDEAITAMRKKNSYLKKLCAQCALYVPYSDEEILNGWKVSRNCERETWTRLS